MAAQSDSTLATQELATAIVSSKPTVVAWASDPSESLDARRLTRFAASDFTPGLNRIPGVRFEQRTPGSYRVSIRNTSRRSPFGVRDVQVYWNGLPLTEPGGDTPLNFVDLGNVDRAAITKGPSSLSAGSPLGGSVGLSTSIDALNNVSLQFGSFGSKAGTFRYTHGDSGKTQLQVRIAHRSTDGHRDWSNFRRTTGQASLFIPIKTSSGWSISSKSHALATRLDYFLPGALTPAQFAENPLQERPGSADALASIDYENVLLGSTIRAQKNDWYLTGAGYVTGFRFDNPFNVNHKQETNFATGLSGAVSRIVKTSKNQDRVHTISAGGETQFQFRDANQFNPNQGTPGDLQFSDKIDSRRVVGFTRLSGVFRGAKWQYKIGVSAVHVNYDVDRSFERGGTPSQIQSDFDLTFSPRLQLTHASPKHNVSISYSEGSSTPSLREFRTNEGSLNQSLRPEIGNSLELYGFYNFSDAFRLSANAYLTQLQQTITTFQDTSGIQLFRNAGRTTQPGLELAIDWQATKMINVSPAYSYQPYTYRDYEVNGTSFAGRPMPGLPTHTADVLVHADLTKRFYADFNIRYESENPLDDEGDVVADAFVLLRLQAGARIKGFHFFLAGDNLLDAVYSLGNDINPQFGNRYFQAAPPRNVNVGVSLDFGKLKQKKA